MDFGKAFTFVFDDPDWLKKLGIAALISLIPILGQVYMTGYALEVGRRVIHREPRPLPDVAFSESLITGLKAAVISFVYSLPIFLIMLPGIIISAVLGADTSDFAFTVTGVIWTCVGLVAIVYGLLLLVIVPAAESNFLPTGKISSAFKFGEIFGLLRAAPGAYLFVLLGIFISGFIAPLGSIACVIGAVVTTAYSAVFVGHLIGQAHNAAREKLSGA